MLNTLLMEIANQGIQKRTNGVSHYKGYRTLEDDTVDILLPGLSKKDISLKFIEESVLQISGENGKYKYDKKYDLSEYNYSSDIDATYENGVLTLKFKPNKERIKEININ